MSQLHAPSHVSFTFGPFRLIPTERLLLRDGKSVALAPKVFDTLLALVERHGMLVSKAELLETVWVGAFVEEGSLCNAIFALRKALADRSYIETVPKKGYRFVAPVALSETPSEPLAAYTWPVTNTPAPNKTDIEQLVAVLPPKRLAILRSRLVYLSIAALLLLGTTEWFKFQHGGAFRLKKSIRPSPNPGSLRVPKLAENPRSRSPVQNPGSLFHAHYKYGRYFLNKRTAEDLRKAIKEFGEACKENPSSAEAYAGLASSYALLNLYGSDSSFDLRPLAKSAAVSALKLDGSLSEAHAAMGAVLLYNEWDWSRADNEFLQAIALDPRNPTAHQWYGLSLAARGQFDPSLRELELAAEIDPLFLIVQTELARVLYLSQRYDEAIEGSQRVLDLDPYFLRAHIRLGEAYEMKRMPSKAIEELRRAVELSTSDVPRATLGWAYALSGQTDDARRCLSELERTAGREPVSPYSMALLYAGLHEPSRMFQYLEKAYQSHASAMIYLLVDPTFSPFHSDTRYLDLIRRMQLDVTQVATVREKSSQTAFAFLRPHFGE